MSYAPLPRSRRPRSPWIFALLGVWVGVLIVLIAWIMAVELTDRGWTLGSILLAHNENPLFWFVDATPIYLGWIGWILGLNERLDYQARAWEQRVLDQPTRDRLPAGLAEAPTQNLAEEAEDSTTLDRDPAGTATVARFAHELRTPLNAVLGYSELMCEELEDAGQERIVDDAERVVRAARHLLALVDDVLDLASLEANRLPVQLEVVEVRSVAEEVLDTVAQLAEARRDTLLRVLPQERLEVRGDPTRIRQVLLNLLANACKFTEGGTVTLEVHEGPEGFVTFEVRDTGIGLSPEQMAGLFREFARVHEDPSGRYAGTGLGLAISRRLAQLMGGRIDVESVPDEGSTFALVLPRAHGTRQPQVTTELTLEERAFAVPRGGDAVALLVHPEPGFRDLLRSAIGAAGFRAEMTGDGEAALDRARDLVPALAVVASELPDMSGIEVLLALKERRGGGRLPVVFLGTVETAEAARGAGAAEVLLPPLDLRVLERIARRYRRVERVRSVLLVQVPGGRRQVLEEALRRDGLDVEAVEDGSSAVRDWRGDPPDLVALELGTDGDDRALERMELLPAWKTVPVLAYAGHTLVGWSLPGLADRVDRVVVCGSDRWEDVVSAVRDGVGDLLASPRA